MKKLTHDKIIQKFKEKHGNKYDYSLVNYINTRTKVKIICPEHGVFEQIPDSHGSGRGCYQCGGTKLISKIQIIKNFRKVHGNKYDYSLVNYVNGQTKVKIICPEHGIFEQQASSHVSGRGCPKCGGTQPLTKDQIIKDFRKVHGNKYDYSKMSGTRDNDKIKIICPEHGIFEQKINSHKNSHGCPSCSSSGFKSKQPAKLYYVRIETRNFTVYKLGITNLTIKARFSLDDFKSLTVLKVWDYKLGEDAYKIEQQLLKEYTEFKHTGDNILKSGNTELFNKDILGLDKLWNSTHCIMN